MADPKALSRDQLAKFLPDHEAIKRFEQLFFQAGEQLPADVSFLYRLVDEVATSAGLADAKAVAAADDLARIAQALEIMASRPIPEHRCDQQALAIMASRPDTEHPRSLEVDYVDFNGMPPHVEQPRRMAWNNGDDTLNLHHSGGVSQQVGQELYGFIPLHSGPNLANGECAGFDPATNTIVPFIADGSLNSVYILGVATQDIANGASGRLTTWGRVRNIDTTGTPFGETWTDGNILYVSTTVAGGLTNVKPTAPNLSIPIAIVRVVDSTVGEIFVRPVIEQRLFYGVFTKTTDQVPAAINTAYALTFDNTEISNGVSIGTPTSRIVVDNAGLYKFSVSLQLTSGSASVKNVWLWFRKNGVDVPNSALVTSLDSATAIRTPSRSLFFSLEAGDYIELMFASDSTAMTVDNIPATAFAPATPAATLTVNQEQQ